MTTETIPEEKEIKVIDVLSQTNSTNIIPMNNLLSYRIPIELLVYTYRWHCVKNEYS